MCPVCVCHVLPYSGPLPVNFDPSLLGVCWFYHYASNHGDIGTDLIRETVRAMSQSDLSEVSIYNPLCAPAIDCLCSFAVW